jgi:hypothetical protein
MGRRGEIIIRQRPCFVVVVVCAPREGNRLAAIRSTGFFEKWFFFFTLAV